jgi:rhamnose transport system substrate-binding protein
MKKLVALVLCVAMLLCAATALAEGQTYAIITKSAGNPYNEREASGFQEVIEAAGYEAIIKHPAEITAEAQITLINELVAQGVQGIAIAANDFDALQTVNKAAMDAGIKVISLDSSCNPESRMTHINQAGVVEVAQALVDATYDLTGGEGDWAILSATSIATNQNAWIDAMKVILEDEKYAKLNLVEISYGDDLFQMSVDKTQALLQNYPDLKLINAPTTVGIAAASKVIEDEGLQGKVIVTGLGLPSEMVDYMTGDTPACPYMFLWNPIDVGRVAAYTLIEMVNGELTGALGESFEAADGNTYTVTEAGDGGTEIIIGPPFRFDTENIEEWSQVY